MSLWRKSAFQIILSSKIQLNKRNPKINGKAINMGVLNIVRLRLDA
jgi:hypothetical protein